jgi:branched-chain amino acid transport system permease protein
MPSGVALALHSRRHAVQEDKSTMVYAIQVLTSILIMVIFAVSLNLLLGYTGQLSMAHAVLGACGGYLVGYLSINYGLGYVPALLLGGLAGLVAGVLISLPAMRLDPAYLLIMTFGFANALLALFMSLPGLGGTKCLLGIQPMSVFGIPLNNAWLRLPAIAIPAIIIFLICWRLAESPFGRVLKGIREDEVATRSLGKNIFTFKLMTFALTAGMAGVAGAITIFNAGVLTGSYFDSTRNVLIISAVILGGAGSIFGPVLGAAILLSFTPVFQQFLIVNPTFTNLLRWVIYGLILVVFLRVRPRGILREGASATNWVRRLTGQKTGLDISERRTIERGQLGVKSISIVERSLPVTSSSEEDKGAIALETRGLVKHFGGIKAVDGLDLKVKRGQITALIGPNGAGKTTVFNLVTGALPMDKGKVYLWGKDVTGLPPDRTTQAGMVRTFQDVRLFYRMSVLENIMIGMQNVPGEHLGPLFLQPRRMRNAENENRERALDISEFVGLGGKADILAGELSFGELKLVSLARVLATDGNVLLLDEPGSGIDRSLMEPIIEIILQLPKLGKTILLIEHNLDSVRALASHVYFLEQGRITAEGTIDELLSQQRLADAYFGNIRSERSG